LKECTFMANGITRTLHHVGRIPREKPPGGSLLGDHLWWARKVFGDRRGSYVSQDRLAAEFNLNRLTLRSLEAGTAKGKSHDPLVKLAAGFGVTLDNLAAYLRGGYGEPGEPAAKSLLDGEAPLVVTDDEPPESQSFPNLRAIFEQAVGRLAVADSKNAEAYASIIRDRLPAFDSPETLTVEKAVEFLKAAAKGGEVAPDDIETPRGTRRKR
jgi:transcriptional regulator with XRE-family HTH domain